MQISASMVKDLRERTGAGMMDCKKALTETGGDFDKAVDFLREKGIAKAASKAGRETSEGIVATYISSDRKNGAIVELSCETDFVARTDDFRNFAQSLAEQAAKEKAPSSVDDFASRKFTAGDGETVGEAVKALVGKLGENMAVRRVEKFEINGPGGLASYIHPGDKLGVIVEVAGAEKPTSNEFDSFSRDVAMHIAASAPQAVTRDEVDGTLIEKEREIYRQQALNEGKPEKIVDKIVDGKIDKFYGEITLLEQAFVKDPDQTIGELVKSMAGSLGKDLGIKRFSRYRLGE